MKYLFFLSGESLPLAKAEIQSVLGIKRYTSAGRLLIANMKKIVPQEQFFSLAYTKKAYSLLFSCKISELKKNMEKFPWQEIYKKNFCIRLHCLDKPSRYQEKSLAGYIWKAVKNPKVNLGNPKTLIEIFFKKDKAYCGLLTYEQKEPFEKRKAHKKPALHPISLHPKLARCLVNLSGAKKAELILDPFCGTGGILIEALLIGHKVRGCDIDKNILAKCKKNLAYAVRQKFFSEKTFVSLINSDAAKITKKYDYIVTDLPYGKSTKDRDIESIYTKFLMALKRILKKKAVVVFPDNINCKKLIRKAGLKIKDEFSYYIHKSMTKKILVIVP